MKSTVVCVDASVAIKVVVRETGSDKADALFDHWASDEKQLIAPAFFEVETDSILRQKFLLRRELTAEQAQSAFASLKALPINTRHSAKQRERAWDIARAFDFPTVYDATYVALAELHQWVVVQFEITPKAFANFSPGLELATTLGHTRQRNSTLKALARPRSRTLSALGRSSPSNPRVEATPGWN